MTSTTRILTVEEILKTEFACIAEVVGLLYINGYRTIECGDDFRIVEKDDIDDEAPQRILIQKLGFMKVVAKRIKRCADD